MEDNCVKNRYVKKDEDQRLNIVRIFLNDKDDKERGCRATPEGSKGPILKVAGRSPKDQKDQ